MRNLFSFLLAFLGVAVAGFAQVTFTCTAGQNFGGNEGCQRIFDGSTSTKWCTSPGDNAYTLFTASEPVFVWGYEFTTANDNASFGRVPRKWTLLATNDATVAADASSSDWVQISQWSNEFIQKKNYATYRFFCNPALSTAYKYFKLIIDSSSDGLFQISKFNLCCDTEPLVTYSWVEGSNDNTKKAVDLLLGQKWEGNDLAGKYFILQTDDNLPHTVTSYSFTTHDDGSCNDRAPKNWTIEGSNDKVNWYAIDHVTNDPIENENYTRPSTSRRSTPTMLSAI